LKGEIQNGAVDGIERPFFDVFDHADDFHRHRWSGEAGDLLADGVFTGEELSGERPVNDRHARLGCVFGFGKVTAS
jgi:hypothetical protein